MRKVLHINSSITGDNSVSRELSRELIERLNQTSEGIELIERDFSKQPIPHLDGARLGALFTPAEARSAEQNQAVAFADQLIDELMQADMVVIALPMYNFTIPSMLKAWVDHVARAGVTFQYTDTGPVGLLSGKKAYLVPPNFNLLADINSRGLIVSAQSEEYDFISRCFFPGAGVNEDPVTGSAHTTLIPYWSKVLNKTKMLAKQVSQRGGILHCDISGDRVIIGGEAVLFLIGEIDLG